MVQADEKQHEGEGDSKHGNPLESEAWRLDSLTSLRVRDVLQDTADSLRGRLGEQLRERDPKCTSDDLQIQNRNIPLAAFDGADEGSVQLAFLAQFVLSPSTSDPPFADTVANSAEEALV